MSSRSTTARRYERKDSYLVLGPYVKIVYPIPAIDNSITIQIEVPFSEKVPVRITSLLAMYVIN
jgi:hypothetical protein